MAFEQEPLPYDYNALEPSGMKAETLEYHYGKHHKGYVDNLNNLTKDTPMADMSLVDVIKASYNDDSKMGIFNNAAQIWNHTFYWNGMKPSGGGAPTGELAAKIDSDLGGLDKFKEEFKKAAIGQFGSGYAWLVSDNGTLKITKTPNAMIPFLTEGQTPLLTLDVWEHAYYLDFRNARPAFIDNFLNHLVNWDTVAQNLAK